MSTGLQEHLARLIAEAQRDYEDGSEFTDVPPAEAAFVAERLASAFQQVGWAWRSPAGDVAFLHTDATRHGVHGDKPCTEACEPVYRFARPEQ